MTLLTQEQSNQIIENPQLLELLKKLHKGARYTGDGEMSSDMSDTMTTYRSILSLINEEKIKELDDIHRNIMENPKWRSDEPDQAFAYARVHRILDERIEALKQPITNGDK